MRPDPVILAFDTSAAHCAAALLSGGRVVAEAWEPMEKGQAERLLPLCEEVMARAGMGWSDLDALAVGTGPGNFTGVRIAVAAARGLALSLGVPAIGVTRLEALAEGLARPLTVVEDARRGEVYVQEFDPDAGEARLTEVASLGVEGCPPDAVGSAAEAAVAVTGGRVLVQPLPLTHAMALIAARRMGSAQPRPAPFYLRGPDAAPPSDPPPSSCPEPDAMTPAALATLHARCFTTPPPWGEAAFAAFLTDPLAFLLTEGDAGFLLGRAVAGEAELLTLAVAPESRRLGLGRKLVARFLDQARLRGAETAFLEVAAENAGAQALYLASGFAESGRRKDYYARPDGSRMAAIVMQRAIL